MMRIALSICALVASAVPAVALDHPDKLVRSLYRLSEAPTAHQDIDRFFARDIAAAMKRDASGAGLNASDWRFDGQDARIADQSDWRRRTRTVPMVSVNFNEAGQASTVVYELCTGSQGWRIANVRNGRGDMRSALGLPSVTISC